MRPLLKLAIVSVVICGTPALARWNPSYGNQPPEVQAWFKDQHNAQGQWCCDESDGHPFYGAYTINKDGSVSINAPDGTHTLPAYMVLKGPNPTGHAVWWYLDVNGRHSDYCFAPGTLT
jgi:hypothetical protein